MHSLGYPVLLFHYNTCSPSFILGCEWTSESRSSMLICLYWYFRALVNGNTTAHWLLKLQVDPFILQNFRKQWVKKMLRVMSRHPWGEQGHPGCVSYTKCPTVCVCGVNLWSWWGVSSPMLQAFFCVCVVSLSCHLFIWPWSMLVE